MSEDEILANVKQGDYLAKYGFADVEDYVFKAEKGIDENIVRSISAMKGEPEWMLDLRLKGY
ncbi:MAG: Fe-S cluster assembly protein SufB, partial [Candidatus Promineifilaceae bacterium]